jgi:hypothetical protein
MRAYNPPPSTGSSGERGKDAGKHGKAPHPKTATAEPRATKAMKGRGLYIDEGALAFVTCHLFDRYYKYKRE